MKLVVSKATKEVDTVFANTSFSQYKDITLVPGPVRVEVQVVLVLEDGDYMGAIDPSQLVGTSWRAV